MKIVAAVIGTGIGLKHIEAIDSNKNSRVKIICETNLNRINYLKKKYPKKIILSDENKIFRDKEINLVSIASYDDYHFRQIIRACRNKKNIIVEKPMCLKLSELKIIKNEVIKNQIKITSNLVLRENQLFKNLKKKIDIKKIYYIEADYIWGRSNKLYQWRSKIKNYSLIHGAAVHMIDLVLFFLNKKPNNVFCIGSKKFTSKSKFKKHNNIIILLEYNDKTLVKINANALSSYPHFHEIKIFQKDKTLVHNFNSSVKIIGKNISKLSGKYPDKKNRKKLIHNFINYLINSKHKKKYFFPTFQEQLDLMSICFATQKSLNLKKKIRIKYI